MAFKRYVGGIIRGTAAERTTVPAEEPINTLYIETDTHKLFLHQGSSDWDEIVITTTGSWNPAAVETLSSKTIDIKDNVLALRLFSTIVFKSGTTYFAINSGGGIVYSGAVAETAIQTALNAGGSIYIADASYDLSGSFAGFTVGTNDTITIGRGAIIRVPNGYSGVMWNMTAICTGTILEGGVHGEQGTPLRQWTWIRMHAPTSGVYGNIIQDCVMSDANIGIKLYISTTTGWINNNWFRHLKMTNCVIFVDFDYDSGITWPNTESTGFFNNHFLGLYMQSLPTSGTSHGFRNIRHKRNSIIDCNVWDANGTQITANFHTDSSHNMAIGGIFSNLNFTDSGTSNKIWDYSTGLKPGGNIVMDANTIKFLTDITLKRHATNTLAVRNAADTAYNNIRAEGLEGTFLRSQAGTTVVTIGSNTLTLADAKDIVLNTTTGTKIGTATTQKLAFFNKTPVTQRAAITAPGTDGTSLQTAVNAIRQVLIDLGLTA